MNTIQCFDFSDQPVRVELRGGEPWFVAADVCRALEIANPSQAVASLDEDELATLSNAYGQPGRGAQSFNIISESGLYALIFKSRKPQAHKFRKWVTGEVLPQIRKTGGYHVGYEVSSPLCGSLEDLRASLLQTVAGVIAGTLTVGKAQQVANTARVFLETIKLEGDAIGYETLFGVRSRKAANLPKTARGNGFGQGALEIAPSAAGRPDEPGQSQGLEKTGASDLDAGAAAPDDATSELVGA